MGYSEFECLQGPLVDYHNSAVLSTLLTELKKYVKAHKGILLRIQPPLILRQGSDPTQLLEVTGTAKALQQLENAGFRAIPPQQTDHNTRYVRWFFAKDLSPYHDDAALL
ncbi:MAG: peptidoglycan bridge formation glycyltransferase FemA/FemB family protein, partial [Candidatus Saccharimonas sp.]